MVEAIALYSNSAKDLEIVGFFFGLSRNKGIANKDQIANGRMPRVRIPCPIRVYESLEMKSFRCCKKDCLASSTLDIP